MKTSSKFRQATVLFVIVLFPICINVGCTSKNRGPDWWYKTEKPRIGPETGLVPQAEKGFHLEVFVSNAEMRKLIQGRVVEMGKGGFFSSDGSLYWWGQYRARSVEEETAEVKKAMADPTKMTNPYSLPEHAAFRYPFFKWSKKNGVELFTKEIPLQAIAGIFENPIDLPECKKGLPIVMGAHRTKMVVDARPKEGTKEIVPGPAYGQIICLENGKETVLFETKDPAFVAMGGVAVNPINNKILMIGVYSQNSIFDEKLEKQIAEEKGRLIAFQEIDLATKQIRTLSDGNHPGFLAIRQNLRAFSDGTMAGLGSNGEVQKCKIEPTKKTEKGKSHPDFQCQALPTSGGYISTFFSDPTGAHYLIGTGATRSRDWKTVQFAAVSRMDLNPPNSTPIAGSFYNVTQVVAADGAVYVWDAVPQSNYSNQIYKLSPQK